MSEKDIKSRKSIQKRVVTKVSIQLAIAMLVISFVSIFYIERNMSVQTKELLESKAVSIQDRLEQRISYLVENTVLLTKNEFVISSFIDAQSRKKYLPPLVKNFMKGKDVVSLNVVDFDGKAIFQTQKNIPTFQNSEELRSTLAFAHLTTYIQKSDSQMVVIVPIEYYSTTQGAVVVVFDISAIAKRNIPNEQHTYIKLLKDNHEIFHFNYNPKEKYESFLLKPSQTTTYLNQLNIALQIGMTQDAYMAPIKDAIIKLSLITSILIIIGVLFSIVLANDITRPIITLYNRVTSSMNDKDVLCAPLGTDDELESLAKAFDERTLMLQYQAEHDSLTELPNRVLFLDRLQQSIKLAARTESKLAVLFIDLDRFKEINDSFGHNMGDELLIAVSKKFESVVRNSDSVARMGGDEFTVVLSQVFRDEVIIDIVQKLMNSLNEPIALNENQFFITCSIGVATYPQNGHSSQELLKNADTAMYRAKQNGRNNYQFYTDDMTQKAYERLTLHTNLRQAVEKGELEVFYQLQTDMRTKEIVGMESLLRWNSETLGFVRPDKFIPIAEETGLIIEIDRFVMSTAMRQFTTWSCNNLCKNGVLSMNLSIIQLNQESFIDFVKEMLLETRIDPGTIMFEITETQIMKNPEHSIVMLKKLRGLGVRLAIDDFGTGHSSLSYLKRLPIDKIKIDQSFVRDITTDESDAELVKTIITLSKSLKMDIIAEGVETEDEIEFLIANGCFEAQGYYYYKPQNMETVEKILHQHL